MPRIPPELCTRCKGYKLLCGLTSCPILERFRVQTLATVRIRGRELEGYTPPSAIVGEQGYPRVRVYYMIPPGEEPERAWYYDSPREWAARREPLRSIISLRSSLVSAVINSPVNEPWRLYELELSLAAVSERPVDSEAVLRKPPIPRLRFDGITKPVGPSSPADRVRVVSNPRIPRPLEKLIWDDVKAYTAARILYDKGIDVYVIHRAMSLGLLGRTRARRLVPTRWAITAVDDIISGILRSRIRKYKWIDRVEVRMGEYLGNRFAVILYPGAGSFDWIEAWHPRGLWTRESSEPVVWHVHEDPLGNATEMDGGFSAARLAVLEHLDKRREAANAIIVREILPTYYAPVGNWHIREHIRLLMEKPPRILDTLREAIDYVLSKLTIDPRILKSKVPILAGRRQSRLTDYWIP